MSYHQNKFHKFNLLIAFFILFLLPHLSWAQWGYDWQKETPPIWAYDPGPNPENPMAQELIEIDARIPSFPEISKQVMRYSQDRRGRMHPTQKFRPAFGPIPWRMILEPNSVKILFIGQDGTHIAEAAGRPATAGFGGRAQDLASYFGVSHSAAFINTYAFTIKGQYGANNAPYVKYDQNGKPSIRTTKIIPNDLWLMSQDLDSPLVKWRNDLMDWILRNNKDSLKMIVLFGGSAKDSIATFIRSKGGDVGYKLSKRKNKISELMSQIQLPEFNVVYAGGNNEFPVPVTQEGQDLYQKLLEKKLTYTNAKDQTAALKALKDQTEEAVKQMLFTGGGPYQNGLLSPAQLGGYDLDQIYVRGKKTLSLKGLTLSDNSTIEDHVLVVELPHPTFLSYKKLDVMEAAIKSGDSRAEANEKGNEAASAYVRSSVEKLKTYRDNKNWKITADPDNTNKFDQGKEYTYGRAEISNVFYDFGTPENRMVSRSTAQRLGPQVVLFGSRDRPQYDQNLLNKIKNARANEKINSEEMYISKYRTPYNRTHFDPGPPVKYAQLLKDLDHRAIYKAKEGHSLSSEGTEALYIQSHPDVGDFGHYRGSFTHVKVLILADPDGYDDLITARALTGTRGQYLNGLMEDLGIQSDYLVIKTVPFGMDGATEEDWENLLQLTASWRENLIQEIIQDNQLVMILTDGPYAKQEMDRILEADIPVFNIQKEGLANGSGIVKVGEQITKGLPQFKNRRLRGQMKNIPREHLTYYSRVWEGTSGDRVLTATDKMKGEAFLTVVPNWVVKQKPKLLDSSKKGIEKLIQKLNDYGLPLPNESYEDYQKRREKELSRSTWDAA